MNKRIRFFFIPIVLIMIIYIILFLIFSDGWNSIEYIIYRNDPNSCFCSKLFFNVPRSYKENIRIRIIEEVNQTQLVQVTNYNDCLGNNYMFLIEQKAIPFDNLLIIRNKNKKNYNEYAGIIVNLNAFNKYIKLHPEFSKEDILLKYFEFRWVTLGKYRILKTKMDLDNLYSEYPVKYPNHNYPFVSLSSLQEKFNIICWQENEGLVGYIFLFENSELIKVDSQFISCIGNESFPCPSFKKLIY